MSLKRGLAAVQQNLLASLHRVSPTAMGLKLPDFFLNAVSGAPTSHGAVQIGNFPANIVFIRKVRLFKNTFGLWVLLCHLLHPTSVELEAESHQDWYL